IRLALLILMATAVVVYAFGPSDRAHMRIGGKMALVLLVVNIVLTAAIIAASRWVPAAPQTNRKIKVAGSRFESTPVAGATVSKVGRCESWKRPSWCWSSSVTILRG